MGSARKERPPSSRRHSALFLAVAIATMPTAAQAVRINYEIGASVLHSDNIGLSEFDEVSDTVLSPELRFNIEQMGSALQLSMEGELQYPYYLDDTFESQLQGRLAGRANWTLLPERIDFEVTDTLTRQTVNVLESFVPSNQQQVNVFTAGPTFHARFSEALRGQLELRYVNTYAEESADFQGNHYSVAARLERLLRITDRVSVNLDALQTDYDDDGGFFNYRRYDAYLGYGSELSSLTMQLEAGYSWVRPDNYDGDSSSPLIRGSIDWRVAPRSTLSAGFNIEFADAAQNLIYRRGPTDGGPILENPVDPTLPIGPQTFKQRRVLLGYRYEAERLSFQLNPYYDRIRYELANDEDQDVKALNVYADYRLRPDITLSAAVVRQKRELTNLFRNDTNTIANLAVTKQLSRNWYVRGYYQRSERDSSSFTQSYTENSVMLMVAYRR
ncbi:outer membrane beta-barrel protein [Pseudoxanthomonas putridarboris]|uniref:Outer membrane beta-barrel protein n=1 Tax=Pseudoxanthomonas putridarboris TaxID=752605 RepID=A0ABU9IZE2_9GAMM